MRWIKELFIRRTLKKLKINCYTINKDYTVDVIGDVRMDCMGLVEMPIKFRNVTGTFSCTLNKLTSLKGCPEKVGGNFNCNFNLLETLEYAPKHVIGSFSCINNKLKTLKGIQEELFSSLICGSNEILSFDYAPKIIKGNFFCDDNFIYSLDNLPEVSGLFYADNCPIWRVINLFPTYNTYLDSLDYNYWRNNYSSIVKHRFAEALEEIGVDIPEYIWGYKYI